QSGPGALRPVDFALRSELGYGVCGSLHLGGHHAASSAEPAAGLRKTIARFCGDKNSGAASRTCSLVTERNPSRMVLTSFGSPSSNVNPASRCIKPNLGMEPPRPLSR